MSVSGDLNICGIVAVRASNVCLVANLGAGGRLGIIAYKIVAGCRDNGIAAVISVCTYLECFPAVLRAGCRLAVMVSKGVSCCRNYCIGKGDFTYEMSILKSADAEGTACNRYTFSYPSLAGLGHFIHTYVCDGNPIPTFQGEPERVAIPDDIDEFTNTLWNSLDENNKISLYVRYVDLESGEATSRMINKNA